MATVESTHDIAEVVREQFRRRFQAEPLVTSAPGRVNLIGEHTDYNDGFVMPAAIEFHTWVAAAARSDNRLVAHSVQFPQMLDQDLNATRQRSGDWTDYSWGVAAALRQAGYNLRGATLLIDGNVPIGSGLSSSAAIEVATGFALLTVAGVDPDRVELARICQLAENEFVGARCGIMDQFISCTGKAGNSVLLDCRSLEYKYAPLPKSVSLVICNTMVKHSIAGGEYNQRRAECERGVALLARHLPGIRALRDVSREQLARFSSTLPEVIAKRCRHVVTENARVLEASDALGAGDLGRLGRLMGESHASLRDDYEVSCPELDIMVELALQQTGVIGSRMTGGGFGGCTISLVHDEAVDQFRSSVSNAYEQRTGKRPEIYVTAAADGVQRVA